MTLERSGSGGTDELALGQRDGLVLLAGIGASAGGLEALKEVLQAIPVGTPLALVVIQHSEPDHVSLLADILARETSLPASLLTGPTIPLPGHLYVKPNGHDVVVDEDGKLQLLPREKKGALNLPVDRFFSSLATHVPQRAVGVVLSGSGADGSQGVKELRQAGGVTIAQAEVTAKFPSMPRSAIATGCVDWVLPPERIGAELHRLSRKSSLSEDPNGRAEEEGGGPLARIFGAVRDSTGVDFSHYKRSTILRRMERRLLFNGCDALAAYAELVERSPAEVDALYRDCLINVTSFFRDGELFDAVTRLVFPKIVEGRTAEEPVRIWVPGCATGEEVYSIAIRLFEFLGAKAAHIPVQFFGTDVSEPSLEKARAGVYPESIQAEVSEERLRRYFAKAHDGYQVTKALREICVFAKHNVIGDPPLSKMDLITCRNLLIYFGPVLQQRVLPLFHYALKPQNSFLLLGKSEVVDLLGELFIPVDKAHKIYLRRTTGLRTALDVTPWKQLGGKAASRGATPASPLREPEQDLRREVDTLILASFSPPGLVVNEHLDIVQFRGEISPYLSPGAGRSSLNVLKMIHPDLHHAVRTAIEEALRGGGCSVRKPSLPIRRGEELLHVSLRVMPLKGNQAKGRHFFVTFHDVPRPEPPPRAPEGMGLSTRPESQEVARLYDELHATRQYMQTIIDEREIGYEELQSANEEITSANEELQTINSELETSKEELESANEELTTVNEELRIRMEDLRRSEERFRILVSGVRDYAIFMLDRTGHILSWNEGAQRINGYRIDEVLGKHFSLFYNGEDRAARKPDHELEVAQATGKYEETGLRVRKGGDTFWASVVITALFDAKGELYGFAKVTRDITERRAVEEALRRSEERFRLFVSGVKDYSLFLLDRDGNVATWNPGAERIKGYSAAEIIGKHFSTFYPEEDRRSGKPARELEEAAATGKYEEEGIRVRKDGSTFWANVLITALYDDEGKLYGFGKVTRDITAQKEAELAMRALNTSLEKRVQERTAELDAYTADLKRSNAELERFAYVSSHDLKEPLRMVMNYTQLLEKRYENKLDERAREYIHFASTAARRMYELIDDLLTFSQLGRAEVSLAPIDSGAVVKDVVTSLKVSIEESQASVTWGELPVVTADRSQLVQLFQNLIGNAVKFKRAESPKVRIECRGSLDEWTFSVKDNGLGIEPQYLDRIFVMFQRLHTQEQYPGTGIGLALCAKIIERHGGRIWVESTPGERSTFFFTLPRHGIAADE